MEQVNVSSIFALDNKQPGIYDASPGDICKSTVLFIVYTVIQVYSA